MRILFIDDDPFFSDNLIRVFKWEGWEVVYARSPAEGLHELEQGAKVFDIILLDIMMLPDHASARERLKKGYRTGLTLLGDLQESPYRNIPVILITARADLEPQDYEGKAALCLRKNQPSSDIIEAIRKLCQP